MIEKCKIEKLQELLIKEAYLYGDISEAEDLATATDVRIIQIALKRMCDILERKIKDI